MGELVCTACEERYPLDAPRWQCTCGGLLDIRFEAHFDLRAISSGPRTLWRYRQALPLAAGAKAVSLGEGFTPLLQTDFCGRPIWVKQDHLSPTGSYKDRGAALLIAQVLSLGIRHVVEDSSGNAGAAIAAYCAHAGIACDIYCPASTSADKTTQISAYGANLRLIPGNREDTARAVMAAAQDLYYASHSWNPFFFHGTKTWAYEVCEQLGWRAPDTVVLPAGNGTLLLGAYMGFQDLLRAGIIHRHPKLVGIQATNCDPLVQAFHQGEDKIPEIEKRETIAEGIAIAAPVRGRQMLAAVRETGGTFLSVTEKEITDALRWMCAHGFYIEPTSAATIAGLWRYLQQASNSEEIATSLTGHGLKASAKIRHLLPKRTAEH